MFAFCMVITVASLIGFVISLICLIAEKDPFALWLTLFAICLMMFFIGGGCGLSFVDNDTTEEQIIQKEQIEETNDQYNYCPYCGKKIA